MTNIAKLVGSESRLEVGMKINEIIDYKANTDLSNLTTTGQAKFNDKVSKSGDTMTGDLAINKTTTTAKISLNSDRFALNATPESSTNTGSILFTKQGVNSAIINNIARADGGNGFEIALRSPDNTVWKSLYFTINPDNTSRFSFPMCTTKASTTSTAGTSLVAVVVQNYKNGNSWYRVWSDGWIEQGGIVESIPANSTKTVTFLKAFTTTNYYINCNQPMKSTYSFETCGITTRTTGSFTVHQKSYNNDGGAFNSAWYACGY